MHDANGRSLSAPRAACRDTAMTRAFGRRVDSIRPPSVTRGLGKALYMAEMGAVCIFRC